jgi:hypothetical protein
MPNPTKPRDPVADPTGASEKQGDNGYREGEQVEGGASTQHGHESDEQRGARKKPAADQKDLHDPRDRGTT